MSPRTSAAIWVAAATAASFAIAFAGGAGLADQGGLGATVSAALIAFGVNWLAFVPSYLKSTERYYDLIGSVSFLGVIGFVWLASEREARATILALMVALWTIRLGVFLFARVSADGRDLRFNKLKVDPWLFFRTWTLQAAWVTITSAAAVAAMSASTPSDVGVIDIIGLVAWSCGFLIEAISDSQKRRFRSVPENSGKFISTGLWAWSRHPNYFGDILLWVGIAVVAIGDLEGWQLVTLISPVFVWALLTRVSGIPLIERRGLKNWGEDPAYQRYLESTPVLIPRPPRSPT